jgi:ech hydrogenase subunit D
MIENLELLELGAVPGRAHELFDAGYRFVTMTCNDNGDGTVDIFYSFDKALKLVTLKVTISKDTQVASISNIYLAAVFAENEIGELFGIKFTGLALNYGGRLVITEEVGEAPFGRGITVERKDGGNNV